jgi:hypothetical protein
VCALISCKPYYQIYKLHTTNCTKDSKDFFYYENDTIKVVYSFWSQGGVVAYTFFNKLPKPLYIDWSKSSHIVNGKKYNYWNDETFSSTFTNANDVYSRNPNQNLVNPYYLFQRNGYSFSDTRTSKPEKISFIPPNSYISVCKFSIYYTGYLSNDDMKVENNKILNAYPLLYLNLFF